MNATNARCNLLGMYNGQPKNMPPVRLVESEFADENAKYHYELEKWASGDLPEQPADNAVDANDGAGAPMKGLRTGR